MDNVELSILLPALLAGILVLATHVLLGMKVLQRGIIFADLAVAQIAGVGVIIAGLFHFTPSPWVVQGMAALGALIGASVLAVAERYLPEVQEAVIGLLFVLAATAGILLLSHDVHAGEHLQELLVGQILWVSSSQLYVTALLSAALLLLWHFFYRYIDGWLFYGLFALAVTASVQLVGIYLVFASLIVPALATYRWRTRRLLAAYAVGIGGYFFGLLCSVWFDLPAGAAIVWAMVLCALLPLLWTMRRAYK